MRIVGGLYKGRIFYPDKSFSAHPTTDMAKEALFNILANRYNFEEMKILDLFSGTGNIAYEFISRGAAEVTLVDSNEKHIRFIKKVLKKLNVDNASVYKTDVFKFIEKCKTGFDIVFMDPPFDMKGIDELPNLILNSAILNNKGLLILEHPRHYDFSQNKHFTNRRTYGKVNFSFFEQY